MRPLFIKTFGCKVNYAESVAFADLVSEAGFTPLEIGAAKLPTPGELERPLVFVNTCCVTKEAERKAAQFVRRIKRSHPHSEVLLTGCAARNHLTRQQYLDAGARVFDFYPQAFEWIEEQQAASAHQSSGISHQLAESATPFDAGIVQTARSRAFIKVQDGCRNMCTFCIIPFVRPYASRPFEEILEEVERRVEAGFRELVLTGVNIGHYGMTPVDTVENIASDKYWRRSKLYTRAAGHPTFFDLVDAILERLPCGVRLRISSIEPEDIDDRFFGQLQHPRMCPHLHLPLQSGSDKVLSGMRRLYGVAEYMALVEKFRRACPDGARTTDILVGFPSESADDFAQTLALCNEAQFERIHGFPFSPRPGTRAAKLTQLPRATVLERNRRLIAHCQDISDQRWKRLLGTASQVLVEKRQNGHFIGHGEAYQMVSIPANGLSSSKADELIGRIVPAELTGYAGGRFAGRMLT
ncbi:MiaB/RimO family radical SAM methylthiotransferase [bacterium]|nr:MiaB/RimO family radical SAM methylthiotransferase [bacterium]